MDLVVQNAPYMWMEYLISFISGILKSVRNVLKSSLGFHRSRWCNTLQKSTNHCRDRKSCNHLRFSISWLCYMPLSSCGHWRIYGWTWYEPGCSWLCLGCGWRTPERVLWYPDQVWKVSKNTVIQASWRQMYWRKLEHYHKMMSTCTIVVGHYLKYKNHRATKAIHKLFGSKACLQRHFQDRKRLSSGKKTCQEECGEIWPRISP